MYTKLHERTRGGSSGSKGPNHKAVSGGLYTQLAPSELEVLKDTSTKGAYNVMHACISFHFHPQKAFVQGGIVHTPKIMGIKGRIHKRCIQCDACMCIFSFSSTKGFCAGWHCTYAQNNGRHVATGQIMSCTMHYITRDNQTANLLYSNFIL